MIECIFTVDYEIYGNGEGSLKDLVYEPAERLSAIFRERNAPLVVFVEVAEMEMIGARGSDPSIDLVKHQIHQFYSEGFELGLHLHPQWYKGRYEKGRWVLDYGEYNLCDLPRERISQIVDRAIDYYRNLVGEPDFAPFSFRAGNWLFQPARNAAKVLADRGIRVDSSVFKGGLQHQHGLDYRRSLRNGEYWTFSDDVEVSDPNGELLELPIHTEMVPTLQRKSPATHGNGRSSLSRLLDFLRLRFPLKLDFCRMTKEELRGMVDALMKEDEGNPAFFRPVVAIGHTKDLVDFETVRSFLGYLEEKRIPVSTFKEVYDKCVETLRRKNC